MDKINSIRTEMNKNGIDYYIVPTSDHHGSEYVCAAFEGRKFLSGFTGSAGTLVVSANETGLWTDGRYFVQAEKELDGTDIKLYRMGEPKVPTIIEYLKEKMNKGQTLAFDGKVVSATFGIKIEEDLSDKNIYVKYECDLISLVWQNRPKLPANEIWELEIDWSGQSTSDKLTKVRKELTEKKSILILNGLDDIMWLFNIRGNDIPQNPIALSYAYITETEAILFVQKQAIKEELITSLKEAGVVVLEYHDFYDYLQKLEFKSGQKILLDKEKCNYYIYKKLLDKAKPILDTSPTTTLKAIKNETELKHIREIYRKDSLAVIKLIKWLKENNDEITEIDVANKINTLRSEIPGFLDVSFDTIAAYGANAAMVHYQADEKSNAKIEKEGLLLVDSGGQYYGGTTDITRTVVMGDISTDIKTFFTAVVKGMLNLSNLTFIHGCTGRNLDIIARKPLWDIKSDFKHGTGHGVGYMLSVHEGPQRLHMKYNKQANEAVLEPGMLISNEPGVYKVGEYGIRIENILVVKEVAQNENGRFLAFETLTYVPIDMEAIDANCLDLKDKNELNEYHQRVYEVMSDYLDEEEKKWLKEATRPI